MFLVTPVLTQGIYSGIINMISTATAGTCHLVTSIYNYQHPDVVRHLKMLDIERKLVFIQSVAATINRKSEPETANIKLNDLDKTHIFEILGSDINLNNDPIELAMNYLYEIIQDINKNLFELNKKIANHNTLWFSSWRTLHVKPLLDDLELNSKLLVERFDDLTKISIFLKNKN